MKNSFQNILFQIEQYKDIKVVSFDIFDTLLFRMVNEPQEVFTLVGEEARNEKLIPQYIAPVEFRQIRVMIEKEARKKKKEKEGTTEVTLDEIYSQSPSILVNSMKIKEKELMMEEKVCYPNPVMVSVLKEMIDCGFKVVLTSDMYLTRNEIEQLLTANHIPLTQIDKIYVSSEMKINKLSGELFDCILKDFNIDTENLVHIGDNYQSDIVAAERRGIKTIYYNLLSDSNFLGMEYEKLVHPNILPEIYSMRKYVSTLHEELSESEIPWYVSGAQIFGPLMTATVEWVLDIATENKIFKIRPLMREGKLFTKLLKKAAKERNLEIDIEELYVSRKAVLIPSIHELQKNEIEEILNAPKTTLQDVFRTFGVEKYLDEFIQLYKDSSDADIYTLTDYVFSYFTQGKVYEIIMKYIKCETEKAWGYLEKKGLKEPVITLDIGFHGTIQKGIEKILQKKGISGHNIHLLTFSVKTSLKNVFQGVDLRGYIGNFGKNDDMNEYVMSHHRLLEEVMMCEDGSTIGYTDKNNGYAPILGEVSETIKQQRKNTNLCQLGIMEFQLQYYKISKEKSYMRQAFRREAELAKPYVRLQKNPTYKEAKMYGQIIHEENYGVDATYRICEENKIKKIQKLGIEKYMDREDTSQEPWLEGMLTCADKEYEFKNLCMGMSSRLGTAMSAVIHKVLKNKEKQTIVIIGAGDAGKTALLLANIAGIRTEAFIDNNKKIQGMQIEGVGVLPMNATFSSNVYILGTLMFADKLLLQAKKNLSQGSTIYYFRDGVVCRSKI